MTKTCMYKGCGNKARVTLIGYSVEKGDDQTVLIDNDIRNSLSYCTDCMDDIADRCKVEFVLGAG